MCGERGEEPDKPYSGRFLVRIDPQLHRELAVAAARQGNSLNAFVASALKDLLVQRAGASEAETPNLRTNAKARAQSSINTYRQEVAATIAEPKVLNAEWTRPRDSMTLRPSTTSPSQTPASNTPTRRQVA
ncbi:MAG: type II toxin-antitoxin system HicB family antitoxin [Gemmatimonadaceae bacterium]